MIRQFGSLFTTLVLAISRQPVAADPAAEEPMPAGCRVIHHAHQLQLESPAFVFTLDSSDGLRARAWENRLTGRVIALGGGAELELDFDAAERRIGISGWKHEGDLGTTHVFLPPEAKDKKLALTLGGFGIHDYRKIEVNLNGQAVGVRETTNRWHEPGSFQLGPGMKIHPFLHFGQDNVLVIRCTDEVTRTERMDRLGVELALPDRNTWPAQFEQYLTIGTPLTTPRLRVVGLQDHTRKDRGEFTVQMESPDRETHVAVTYCWTASDPVLHKFVQVENRGKSERRLMNVRLGDYATDVPVSDGEQGFPVYLSDECFAGLAHPSGWAIGQDKHLLLRQYPGRILRPGERFDTMEALFGNAPQGGARTAFLAEVQRRSRRVCHGHDQPYAIYDTFGANEIDGKYDRDYDLNERYILRMLDKLRNGQAEAGYQFDYVNTHFWVDRNGDLEQFNPKRFPSGFTNIKARLDAMGIKPGLWIDSSWAAWSIGGNPVVHCDFTHDPAYEQKFNGEVILCRATDPIRTMYSTAFVHHIQEKGVRLIKCDNLRAICYNPNHPHLPGVYSTEAIQSAVIQTFQDWNAACPDLFIMLYWGYRSPWWLLHGDSISEPGLQMEAASPGAQPCLYTRDGVTLKIDQGQQWREDVPPLGKDTLGIWLSDWDWNSRIGKERWQEGFAMDLCRGSMLAQIWTDYDWLTPPERKQLAEFLALLRARPKCFGNPRPILGNLWKHEPYGYCCSDGTRAFLALNNCTWSDVALPLELNSKWGLGGHEKWSLYRCYPRPAKLSGQNDHIGRQTSIALRPFEIVLLEVVPAGEPPSLNREFRAETLPSGFTEASRAVSFEAAPQTAGGLLLTGLLPVSANGGLMAITETGTNLTMKTCRLGAKIVSPSEPPFSAGWQVWRLPVEPSAQPTEFELRTTAGLNASQAEQDCRIYFIPKP